MSQNWAGVSTLQHRLEVARGSRSLLSSLFFINLDKDAAKVRAHNLILQIFYFTPEFYTWPAAASIGLLHKLYLLL